MTTENNPTPKTDYDETPQVATQRQMTLTFLGLIAGPLLALICAVMGFVLILNGKTIAGVVFLLVPTQLFLFVGLWAYNARKKTGTPNR